MTHHSQEPRYTTNVQAHLQQVQRLLAKCALAPPLTYRQEASRADRHESNDPLSQNRYLSELRDKLNELHPADIASILEALPITQRFQVWNLIKADRGGEILVELSNAVCKSLLATLSYEQLCNVAGQLDTDKIAALASYLPQPVMREVFKSLAIAEREQLRTAMSYPRNTVGALMDFDMVTIREDATLEAVTRRLRRFDTLPAHTDQLFVVDRDNQFKGVLLLNRLLVNEPEIAVSDLIFTSPLTLRPDGKAQQAAQAFARYDLISAPVVDEDGKLIGRVTVHAVLNFIRTQSESDVLNRAGLHQEDAFASVWQSVKSRWVWLALNLCVAFIAARIIGNFEDSIAKFIALAALMPIVASMAGNSGYQTYTLAIRALASEQLNSAQARRLLNKELAISLLNGLMWGCIAGALAYLLYNSAPLGLIVAGSMLLSLPLGALAGILIPLAMQQFSRNPAVGSSILLAAITNSGGFFIFLGLATIFLMP